MKTAMQELIDKLNSMVQNGGDSDLLPAIEHARYLLVKEKQQIEEAYRRGVEDERYNKLDFINNPYYSQTYKNDVREPDKCTCLKCSPQTIPNMRFIVCLICGNKRCPHALDHNNECTNSNEVGQISKKTKNENHV